MFCLVVFMMFCIPPSLHAVDADTLTYDITHSPYGALDLDTDYGVPGTVPLTALIDAGVTVSTSSGSAAILRTVGIDRIQAISPAPGLSASFAHHRASIPVFFLPPWMTIS